MIGASEKAGSIGRAVLENLAAFPGPVFPVNPKHMRVFEKRCVPNVTAIDAQVDLAVIATPAATVPEIIGNCVKSEISTAIILSAGFKECGETGRNLEKEILAQARGRMRILGPNCLGAMIPHTNLNASFAKQIARKGCIALLSQSGALCTGFLDWSFRENVGFSGFVSVGSMIDVNWGDLIDYFAEDPHTKSIFCYIESIGNARAFMSAARAASLTKPVIVLKAGRTSGAAAAALSHTGSLTGADDVVDAAIRRCGAMRVNSLEELFDMAELVGKQRMPTGPKLAIVTNAGGPGVLAADSLAASGAKLADFSPATVARLNELLPPYWSHGNPVDILGDADSMRFSNAVDCVANDLASDGILVLVTPQAMTDVEAVSYTLRDCAARIRKPLLANLIGGVSVAAGRAILNAAEIPTFDTPEAAASAFALASRFNEEVQRLYEVPDRGISVKEWSVAHSFAGSIIDAARSSGRRNLNAEEACAVARAYGIPVTASHIALIERDAIATTEKVGFPVAVKLHSDTILHKSDVGGVVLGVENLEQVRRAWRMIKDNVSRKVGSQSFQGVTIQPMVQHSGIELILGSVCDPQFGPTVLFGAGGKSVEIMADTAIGLPPLNSTLARRLMERTKIFQVLQGVRGQNAANLELLESLLVRFGEMVVRERGIAQIEINPLMICGNEASAVDVRVILQPKEIDVSGLPPTAIRPYPTEYIFDCRLKNQTLITLRPIRAEDEPLMAEFHQKVSDRSVYFRYFTPIRVEERVQHDRLCRRCCVDYDREQVLVAEHFTTDGKPHLVAVGRLARINAAKAAEFALLVADEWQGHGLGLQLLAHLVNIGEREGLNRITGIIMEENHAMRKLADKIGFTVTHSDGEWIASLDLPNS